jgi:hypothetical protein
VPENSIGIAPDSTGQRVRVVERSVAQKDGTIADVEQQVMSLADRFGHLFNPDVLMGIYCELRRIRCGLNIMLADQVGGNIDLEEY